MSVSRRVTSTSSSRTCSPRSNFTPSRPASEVGGSIDFDNAQVLFKSSSLALLRAKRKGGNSSKRKSVDDPTYIAGANRVLKFMYQMWQEQIMCDVHLDVQGGNIYAHKVAMAAYSTALAERFSIIPFGETATVDLTDMPSDTVVKILEFIYTTDITIDDSNVGSLLFCASELGMEILIKLCLEHLSKINPDNAMFYYSIVEQQGLDDLRQKIYGYTCENFLNIVRSANFVHMPLEKLIHLLSVDNLNINSELDIFLAIVTWIDHNRRDRLPMAPMLLVCVRFQLISPEVIATRVEIVDWLFAARENFDILYTAMKFHALKLSGSQLALKFPVEEERRPGPGKAPVTPRSDVRPTPAVTKTRPPPLDLSSLRSQMQSSEEAGSPRSGQNTNNQIFTFNQAPPGYGIQGPISPPTPQPRSSIPTPASARNRPESVITPLTQTDGHWFRTSLRLTPRSNGMDVMPGKDPVVVAIGGIDLQSIDPDVPGRFLHKLDTATNRWTALTTLSQYTHHHAVAHIAGKIFVTGGCIYDYLRPDRLGVATRNVQVFDVDSKSWHQPSPMREARAYHAAASWKSFVFVIGGEDDRKRKLDSVEKFDPVTNRWTMIARLPTGARVGVAAAVSQSNLFIVGGFNKDLPGLPVVADVNCYDLEEQRWIPKAPLPFPRCHAGLVEASGRLYLIGGRTRNADPVNPIITSLSSILEYDPFTDVWTHVADMRVERHDFGCTAIGSKVYVAGGMNSVSTVSLDLVECFDVDTGVWEDTVDQLPFSASGIACCAAVA